MGVTYILKILFFVWLQRGLLADHKKQRRSGYEGVGWGVDLAGKGREAENVYTMTDSTLDLNYMVTEKGKMSLGWWTPPTKDNYQNKDYGYAAILNDNYGFSQIYGHLNPNGQATKDLIRLTDLARANGIRNLYLPAGTMIGIVITGGKLPEITGFPFPLLT